MTRSLGVRRGMWGGVAALALLAACSPKSLVDVTPPGTVVDPSVVTTSSGATQLYNYAVQNLATVYAGSVNSCVGTFQHVTALASDEAMLPGNGNGNDNVYDRRLWDTNQDITPYRCTSAFYGQWHQPRVEARQARQALQLYAATAPVAWQGRLYALEAYSVLMFAEFFCSGIPMSTVTLLGVATPTAGYTTEQMFTYAAGLFDSAIVVGKDSARFANLGMVGKGRALLGLGKFADAAAAVAGVPTSFVYNLDFIGTSSTTGAFSEYGNNPRMIFSQDNEGTNGLVWSTDPRTAIVTTPALSGAMKYSAKFSRTSTGVLDPTVSAPAGQVWLASGVEARLIEAEADVAAGGSNWLTILNTLRSTCIGTAVCAPVPGLTAASLPPLADPGTPDTRLNLVMQERAMWLFLTGHRHGDMRRLAHVYHRDKATVWPTGVYVNPGFPPLITSSFANGTAYGTATVGSPEGTSSEAANNPLYTGCVNYDP